MFPGLKVSFWPLSADRHNGVCWSSRKQTVRQHGCKWLVSGNANEWSSPCNYRLSKVIIQIKP